MMEVNVMAEAPPLGTGTGGKFEEAPDLLLAPGPDLLLSVSGGVMVAVMVALVVLLG